MFKKKHVVFRTNAPVERAAELLRAHTTPGSPSADDVVGLMKDTLSAPKTAFRGEVTGPRFKLTRRRRGRRVRIAVTGALEPTADGGTELRASMEAPLSLKAGLVAGLVALLIVTGGIAAAGGHLLIPLLMLLAQVPAALLANAMYERETSATFSALRDAVPAHVPEPIAPISAEAVSAPAPSSEPRVPQKG